jgi:hypothetical protein
MKSFVISEKKKKKKKKNFVFVFHICRIFEHNKITPLLMGIDASKLETVKEKDELDQTIEYFENSRNRTTHDENSISIIIYTPPIKDEVKIERYVGQKNAQGKKQGFGTLIFLNGDSIEGEFNDDEICGNAILKQLSVGMEMYFYFYFIFYYLIYFYYIIYFYIFIIYFFIFHSFLGCFYNGQFEKSKKHGMGTLIYQGKKYIGSFLGFVFLFFRFILCICITTTNR